MKYEVDEIIIQSENWLKKPVETDLKNSMIESDELIKNLQKIMLQEEAAKRIIGPLLAKVKGMQKAINSIEKVNWIAVKNGLLSIGHRPSSKLGTDLKLQNTTHILTLLSESEGGKKIESISNNNNLEWLWFPMKSASPPTEDRLAELAELFITMKDILENKGKVYMHCSAGIHRTGMIGYAFLRFIGYDIENAKLELANLRINTSEGVGDHRMEWGDSIYKVLKNFK